MNDVDMARAELYFNGVVMDRQMVLSQLSVSPAEYDIASLYMVSFYCFVTKACARRPSAAASVERRRRERRTLLAGAAGELAGATRLRQARPSSACTFSADCAVE
jgi:hypothetical protein